MDGDSMNSDPDMQIFHDVVEPTRGTADVEKLARELAGEIMRHMDLRAPAQARHARLCALVLPTGDSIPM